MKRVGFIVNPIAGMGGSVGLKGTDGAEALKKAVELGAKPVAPTRAERFLKKFKSLGLKATFLTPSGAMGETYSKKFNFKTQVVVEVGSRTSGEDTKKAAKLIKELKPEALVFVGGDGTARDVLDVVDQEVVVLGVPSGVKTYSSVFSIDPESVACVVTNFLKGLLEVGEGGSGYR